MYYKIGNNVVSVSGVKVYKDYQPYNSNNKKLQEDCKMVTCIKGVPNSGIIDGSVLMSFIKNIETLTTIILEKLPVSMTYADSLMHILSLSALKTCYIEQIDPDTNTPNELTFNKQAFINILKLLQTNDTIETFEVNWQDNHGKRTRDYYADRQVQEAAKKMIAENTTLKNFTVLQYLSPDDETLAKKMADTAEIFKESYTLEKCRIGGGNIEKRLNERLVQNKLQAYQQWERMDGPLSLMSALYDISPTPLILLLAALQTKRFSDKASDAITNKTIEFYITNLNKQPKEITEEAIQEFFNKHILSLCTEDLQNIPTEQFKNLMAIKEAPYIPKFISKKLGCVKVEPAESYIASCVGEFCAFIDRA